MSEETHDLIARSKTLVETANSLAETADGRYWTYDRQVARETLIAIVPELVEVIERLIAERSTT